MKQTQKTAVVIGATGLIGRYLVEQLLEHAAYDRVIAITRRDIGIQHEKLVNPVAPFERMDETLVNGDELFCALGTTRVTAGSKEAQYKVDFSYPLEFGKMAMQNGVKKYLLVSSIGADAQSGNFYLRTKGELEEALRQLRFPVYIVARPSVLRGPRKEFRLGEKIGIGLSVVLAPLLLGGLKRYRSIHAATVARALIHAANSDMPGEHVLESDVLAKMGRE